MKQLKKRKNFRNKYDSSKCTKDLQRFYELRFSVVVDLLFNLPFVEYFDVLHYKWNVCVFGVYKMVVKTGKIYP